MKPSKADKKAVGKPRPGGPPEADPAPGGDVFDEQRVKRLVRLMNKHGLTEIDLQQGEMRVRLSRAVSAAAGMVPMAALPAAPAAAPAAGTAPAAPAEPDRAVVVKSPMVGTFYRASGPDAPPFVKVGDRIEPEKTVCIIEAMKVFNEIPAGVSGQVVAILVENGAPVEFGQALLKVDPEH
ncbi:MAG: acetyl-CoA carboxylase biotin carboxyl carrier protein [Planctomycetota bacterium]